MAKTRFKYLKPEDIRKLAGFEVAQTTRDVKKRVAEPLKTGEKW